MDYRIVERAPFTIVGMKRSFDRRRNAQLFEDAFYGRRNLNPKMKEQDRKTVDVPEDIDSDLLAKVLTNPEMKALLVSLVKTMEK